MSNTNLSPLTEVIARVQREIEVLRDTAHILTPMARTTGFDAIAIGKIPVLRIAAIDPDPTHGEVYFLKNVGRFALTKVGLMRLEAIAGITGWTTKIEHVNNSPLHVKATASAEITDIDGTKRGKPLTVEINLTDGSPQAEKMIRVKDGVRDDRELKQARVNIVRLAESKAMNAVRRDLLNLQATFTREELSKPFVIMRLVDAPLDPNDPLVKKLLIMKQLNVTSEMYEAASANLLVPQELTVIEAPERPALPAAPIERPAPNDGPELKAKDVLRVEELYKRKVAGGRSPDKPPLADLSIEQLLKLEEILLKQPDIVESKS